MKLAALQLFRDTFENIDVEVSANEAKRNGLQSKGNIGFRAK